ncbi:helix-turn-helix domain-containing protein [Angustibacter sp. McL0619]|uniref:helix-turn-helix domain-containing protein n=1 Tax=Angustibacter sp. McL0619 TaxID=3415676 RepID=UPI003CECC611
MKLKSAGLMRELMGPGACNLSLGELAEMSHCHKSFVSHLLSGRRSSCTPELAERIARSLRVPVTVLFDARLASTTGTENKSEEAA